MNELTIVVPCFNEAEVLQGTHGTLVTLLQRMIRAGMVAATSRICYVDDGSTDCTFELIEQFASGDANTSGMRLSRNRGHQNAVLAGLLSVTGDWIITIDADLQDDIAAIEQMVAAARSGAEVVYGVRNDRTSDSAFKRITAGLYYRLMQRMGIDIVRDHADFRLLSRRAVEALRGYREVNLFLRGIVPHIGFRSATVAYRRMPRTAGTSKYPLRRMLSLAWDGITSTSVVPLHFVTATGVLVFLATVLLSLGVLGVRLFTDRAVPGWASTVLPIYLLGGIQILCIGILGEYLGKIYRETKARPRFLIDRTCGSGFRE